MKEYINLLTKHPLFNEISEQDIYYLLECLSAKKKSFNKDEVIFEAGDSPEAVGIVMSGSVYVVQEDYWGGRNILSVIGKGGIFSEAFSCADAKALPVSVLSREDSDILLIDCKKILTTCSSACVFHTSLIKNLMKVLANKNIFLTRKMEHITKKTTREKVLSFLSERAVTEGKNTFQIEFNRQELADYLAVDRSALSYTLSRMKAEGLIDYHKNTFRLKDKGYEN
jgi:CRP-like cAMP-binding protein